MAGVTGLEPAASGVTGRRSNQLSYTPAANAPGGAYLARHPRGVKQTTAENKGFSWVADASRAQRSMRQVVGDEGFEPPTPSV